MSLRSELEALPVDAVMRLMIEAFGYGAVLEALAQHMDTKAHEQIAAYPGAAIKWKAEAAVVREQAYRMRFGWPRII